jgi:predicted phosphodiesterase
MRIGFVSDLHLERLNRLSIDLFQRRILKTDADVIVIGGDTYTAKTQYLAEEFFEPIKEKFKTIIVKGNHDYYGGVWEDDFFEDGDFVGGCLWTNFGLRNDSEDLARKYITDFRVIEGFSTDKCKEIFYDHKKKIFKSPAKFVVTHFPPSNQAIQPKFFGDPLNPYFINDLEREIMSSNKKFWFCGHTHAKFDFMVGDCRVFSNPFGYLGELYESPVEYQVLVLDVDL